MKKSSILLGTIGIIGGVAGSIYAGKKASKKYRNFKDRRKAIEDLTYPISFIKISTITMDNLNEKCNEKIKELTCSYSNRMDEEIKFVSSLNLDNDDAGYLKFLLDQIKETVDNYINVRHDDNYDYDDIVKCAKEYYEYKDIILKNLDDYLINEEIDEDYFVDEDLDEEFKEVINEEKGDPVTGSGDNTGDENGSYENDKQPDTDEKTGEET